MPAASFQFCGNPLLQYCVWYAFQDTFAAATILHPIFQVFHLFLFFMLLRGSQIWIHWIHHCCYSWWEIIGILSPNMPTLTLMGLFFHHILHLSSTMPPSSTTAPIILQLFCCSRHTASLPHILCFYINHCASPLPFTLISLSVFTVILHVSFCHPRHPVSLLTSIIHHCLHYLTYMSLP